MSRPAVLFVCLGNICRSPLAEAAFRLEAMRIGLDAHVESAGTAHWHIGKPPDPRSQAVARRYGVDISSYRAQRVAVHHFSRFTHIVALDPENLADLRRLRPHDATAELSLLLDHVEGRAGQGVIDPYYGDAAGFEATWADVTAGAAGLARRLAAR